MNEILLAIILGGAFGFVLQRIGATNPQNIINMVRLRDFHLPKIILFVIGVASLLVFIGAATGLLDVKHFSVKTADWAVVVGGLIFGIGFAIAGYCPGTSVASIGEGRKDAMVFVLGGLIGAGIFTAMYGSFKGTFLYEKILGGKVTLAETGNAKFAHLLDLPPLLIVGVLAIIFIVIAFKLPGRKAA